MKQLPIILMGLCFLLLLGFCGFYAYNLFVKSGTKVVFFTSPPSEITPEIKVTENKNNQKVLNGFELWEKEININYTPEIKDIKELISKKELELAGNSQNHELSYSLGYYYLIDGDMISAMNKFKGLSVSENDKQSVQLAKAYIYYLNKDYEKALSIINEVEHENPDNNKLLVVKAVFNKLQGKKKEALSYYAAALKKDPTNVSIQKAIKELN